MMNTRVICSGAAAIVCAGALTSAQIAPQGGTQQRPPQPTTQQPRAATTPGNRVITLTGCLYREQDVPGGSPNVAERAGLGEDFILADATMANQSTALGSPIAGGADRPGATAGLATGRMYKVKEIEEDRLRALVGKRVEVTGSIKAADPASRSSATASSERSRNLDNLPDIEATSVREVAGANCPAPADASSPTKPGNTTTPGTSPGDNKPGDRK